MTELLTSAQMRAIEQAAFETGQATGLELMERAGQGVVDAFLERFSELSPPPAGGALVLCGPGNNGGDGFVIARLLSERGWNVTCFLYGDSARLPDDARTNHDRWAEIGPVVPFGDWRIRERWGQRTRLEPVPALIMIGSKPAMITATVIAFGRTLSTAPSSIACFRSAIEFSRLSSR